MKKILVFVLLSFFFTHLFAQPMAPQAKIEWLSFEEALKRNKKEPRKWIIDVFTDWCGWCKRMDATTFTDPNIVAYVNANYYAVKFNAEGTDTIHYKGKSFYNAEKGKIDQYGRLITRGTHQLAYELMGTKLSYPTLVYMDDSAKLIAPIGGYRSAIELQPFLVYFSENLYTYINLQDFLDDFNKTFFDTTKHKSPEPIKWLTIEQAVEKQKKEPRKIVLYFESDWCLPCKVMDSLTFKNPTIAKYLSEKMYPVRFNVTSKTPVTFKGQTYVNEQKEHPFHQFAVSLLQAKMQFPAFVFVTDKQELITNVPGYYPASNIEPLLHFFNEDHYLTKQWNAYMQSFKTEMTK